MLSPLAGMRATGTRCRAHALDVCPASARLPPAGRLWRTMRPKKTILCVDDNEQILSVRKFLLETRGYRVIAVRSAEEALVHFRLGGIDLVLGDLVMPQMDGNEMVRCMKDICPEVPMILISGS